MSELKPCPFCGGEARVEHDHNSANLKERWSIWHECCEHEGESAGYGHALFPWYETPWYYTEAEAIEAWNTRAERTCENNAPAYLDFLCSECGFVHYHSEANDTGGGNEWNYCPNCGARVVSE